jgi:hypothetical protein
METILNDKSKTYERITLETLLAFIKTNLSSLQPLSEIIMIEPEATLNPARRAAPFPSLREWRVARILEFEAARA